MTIVRNIKCDRCHYYEPQAKSTVGGWASIAIGTIDHVSGSGLQHERFDLCGTCAMDFRALFMELREKPMVPNPREHDELAAELEHEF